MKKPFLHVVITWVLLQANAYANVQQYQIELLVFNQANTSDLSQEDWEIPAIKNIPNHAVHLRAYQPDQADAPYQLLPQSKFSLSSQALKPILHIAWLQPIQSRHSQPVVIDAAGVKALIQFTLSNYIELTTAMYISPQSHSRNTFELNEKRRLKLGEAHYLDHPAVGALVKVTRIT